MPLFYQLAHPGISSISHGGREYPVNDAGLLEVPEDAASPALIQHITSSGGRPHIDEATEAQNARLAEDEHDRQILFIQLDTALGRRVDRRRSLAQLREMLEQHHRDLAKREAPDSLLTAAKEPAAGTEKKGSSGGAA